MPAPRRQPVPKKMLFAAEYLKDQNGTQAAIRAGYHLEALTHKQARGCFRMLR